MNEEEVPQVPEHLPWARESRRFPPDPLLPGSRLQALKELLELEKQGPGRFESWLRGSDLESGV